MKDLKQRVVRRGNAFSGKLEMSDYGGWRCRRVRISEKTESVTKYLNDT